MYGIQFYVVARPGIPAAKLHPSGWKCRPYSCLPQVIGKPFSVLASTRKSVSLPGRHPGALSLSIILPRKGIVFGQQDGKTRYSLSQLAEDIQALGQPLLELRLHGTRLQGTTKNDQTGCWKLLGPQCPFHLEVNTQTSGI